MVAFLKMFVATVIFAAVHSALASLPVKGAAERRFGKRVVESGYRVFFIAQSLAGFGLLVAYALRLPRQTLYRVRGLPALLLRLGQVGALVHAAAALRVAGVDRMSGLQPLLQGLRGEARITPPVAQGPELGEDGCLETGGPFQLSRHPLNFSPLPFFWLTPGMTTRRLGFNLATTAYLVLGSYHEEARLKAVYGQPYQDYLDSGVPFYWPGLL